jgi:hypothetical protein
MIRPLIVIIIVLLSSCCIIKAQSSVILENQNFRVIVDQHNGAISSILVKKIGCDLVSEKRLMANYRICLQSDNYLCDYIDGMTQNAKSVSKQGNTIIVVVAGMTSPKGTYPIDLTYYIKLEEDFVSFKAKLINNDKHLVSEFWFPRIGGLKDFGQNREAKLAYPGYNVDCRHNINLFKNFPGGRGLGSEAAEWSQDYPGGMPMPWWDIYDEKSDIGLYLGYHDTTLRYSTWHAYLEPNSTGDNNSWLNNEQAAGQPVGLVFSHVRYPFIHSGETFESGEFFVRVHKGDWHNGSQFYRQWFLSHFPFDKSQSWLRKESAWFSSIIYQPEDRIVTDYKGYEQWTNDAKKFGINCYELIGWNNGGLERNYPLYFPEEKLGGIEGFKTLLKSIKNKGGHCLVFCNYNILDENTDWYKRELFKYMAQDQFGKQAIWMGWGESTLLARKQLSVRYHVRSSVIPEIENILDGYFEQLVKYGADGFQIDKVCVGSTLDFNPLNTAKPDIALCEGLVQSIGRVYKKCKEINPDFCVASEFGTDRLIPYFDIGYRNSAGYEISPLRYVFPEWTSCQHVSLPRDFKTINGAVLTGSVICAEPDSYQGTMDQPLYRDWSKYIQEVERIRKELADIIFMGKYYDDLDAKVFEVDSTVESKNQSNQPGAKNNSGDTTSINGYEAVNLKSSSYLHFKVHGNSKTDQRAIIIANDSPDPVKYVWQFTNKNIKQALLYEPYGNVITVNQGDPLIINGNGLQILVEK